MVIACNQYVESLLALYLNRPDTPNRVSRYDRALALQLHTKGVPLQTIEEAFLLTSARRLLRDPSYPKLNPIRSLHYFIPVIEEILVSPPPPDYFIYLRRKLATHTSSQTPFL